MDIQKWYQSHKSEYNMTEARLEATRKKFLNANTSNAGDMLFKSYVNAVISQQTPVDRHEAEYVNWIETGELLGICNYPNQKSRWIDRTDRLHVYNAVRMLKAGNIMPARDYLKDHFVGLGYMKASFTLAMLGFTECLCIDTNVAQVCGIDGPSIKGKEAYDKATSEIISRFSDLELSPFLTQWVIFDFNRGNHSTHRVWFKSVGTWF